MNKSSDVEEIELEVGIADRYYPIRTTENQMDYILDAAKMINKDISDFSKKYSVKDKQDGLAMYSLKLLVKHLKEVTQTDKKVSQENSLDKIERRIDALNHKIELRLNNH